jgi:hypothetical protein
MPPVPALPLPPPPTRYAIQKARGSGWKTLEVGETLEATQTRFQAMIKANPRAIFRLIRLDPLPGTSETEHEFTWKLIELYDPRQMEPPPVLKTPVRPRRAKAPKRPRERIALPLRFYLTVVVIGLCLGAFLYLHYGTRR